MSEAKKMNFNDLEQWLNSVVSPRWNVWCLT